MTFAMCGRFSLIAGIGELQERFDFDGEALEYAPRFNIAPTQEVLTVVGGESRRGGYMRWGLIPPWTKDLSTGRPVINARAETVAERPAFRNALRRRRCLVLADGFYEWQRVGRAKRPMRVVHAVGRAVCLCRTLAELLFEVVSQRYERGSVLVTTNLPFDEWTEVFGSERLTGALLDRLTHHVHIIEMNGESYRLQESRQTTAMLSSD